MTNIYDRDASQLMIVLGQLEIAGQGTDDVLLFRYENDAPDAVRSVSHRKLRELDRYIAACRHAHIHRDSCPMCDAATENAVTHLELMDTEVNETFGGHTHRLGHVAWIGGAYAAMTDDRDLIGTGIVSFESAVRALRLDHKRRSHHLAWAYDRSEMSIRRLVRDHGHNGVIAPTPFLPGDPLRRTVDTAAMMVLADDPDVRRALRTLNAAGITTGTMFEAALRLKAEQDARLAPALAQRETVCPNGSDCTDCRLDRERGKGREHTGIDIGPFITAPSGVYTHPDYALGRSDMLRTDLMDARNRFEDRREPEVHTAACHLSDTHNLCFRIPSRHHDETRMPCVVRQEKAVRLWTKRNRARREYPEIYATSGLYPDSVADLIAAIDPDPSAL